MLLREFVWMYTLDLHSHLIRSREASRCARSATVSPLDLSQRAYSSRSESTVGKRSSAST